MLIVSLYVNDLMFIGNHEKITHDFKDETMKKDQMNDLSFLHYFLGIEINQRKDGPHNFQWKYAQPILSKFKVENCHPVTTQY